MLLGTLRTLQQISVGPPASLTCPRREARSYHAYSKAFFSTVLKLALCGISLLKITQAGAIGSEERCVWLLLTIRKQILKLEMNPLKVFFKKGVQMWWFIFVILALERLVQEDHEFEASRSYMMISRLVWGVTMHLSQHSPNN